MTVDLNRRLTLSLWKGRNTKRPKASKAPVLREMINEVLASQVILAADLATAVWLANEVQRLMERESTLVPRLKPEKLAWGAAEARTALLLLRGRLEATPVMVAAAQEAISSKKSVAGCTNKRGARCETKMDL